MNDRPLSDPNTQQALNTIYDVFRYYDLAGGVAVINPQEWGYGYVWDASWNANVDDRDLPEVPGMATIGFRVRAKEADLGHERAQELLTGSAFVLTSLKDFGTQTQIWARDLIKMLRKNGMQIDYKPFNGHPLPRLHGVDMRRR